MARSSSIRFKVLSSAAVLLFGAAVGCGNDDDDDGAQQSSLASTCSQICNNVLAKCGITPAAHAECLNSCQYLQAAQVGCVDETAAYLSCLGGATSVECGGGGQYVLLSPPSCAMQQRAYEACRAGGPPLAVCLAQPFSNPT